MSLSELFELCWGSYTELFWYIDEENQLFVFETEVLIRDSMSPSELIELYWGAPLSLSYFIPELLWYIGEESQLFGSEVQTGCSAISPNFI